jgi:hypothetical protein
MPDLHTLKRRASPLFVAGLTGLALLLSAGTASPAAASSTECDYIRDVLRSGGTVYWIPPECEIGPVLW